MNSWLQKTFAALSVRAYRRLWLGSVFTFAGMQMQVIARGDLAFDLTGSNSALGGVMFGFAVPMLTLSLWGGVVADRFPKRKLLIFFQSLMAGSSGLLATVIALEVVEYWMLVATGAVQGACFSFIGPARMAFTGDLVGRDRIANAIALQQMSMRSTQVVGPALAGVLIGVEYVGTAGVYYLTTLGFIASTVLMFGLPEGAPRPRAVKTSPVGDLVEGLGYVKHHGPLLLLLLTSFVVVSLGFPFQSFLPSITEDIFGRGPTSLGLLSATTAVGAIFATLVVASLADYPGAWRIQMAAGIAMGGALIFLGFAPTFVIALLIAMPLLGAFSSGFQSLNSSLSMTMAEQQYQGRVMSLSMLAFSFSGLASLPVGIVADAIGLRQTFMILGVLMIGLVIAINFVGSATGLRSRVPEVKNLEGSPSVERAAG